MSISMDAACLQCGLRRNIATVTPLGTDQQTMDFARELMKLYLDGPADVPSTWFTPEITRLLHERYGLGLDRFRQEKLDSNALVLSHMVPIRQRVEQAADPLLAGLQFSILGNYLDFSALQGQISFEKFTEMLDTAQDMELDEAVLSQFRADLETGKKLLYLTDNAGEIGFDRIFAETICRLYPDLDICFCVRGGPALNDATREDAKAVGIPFRVIDNGNLIPGTWLPQLGQEARQAMEEADVIFAKGMANVETLLGCGKNIYYAFLVKCQRFVNLFHQELMTPMLVRERKVLRKKYGIFLSNPLQTEFVCVTMAKTNLGESYVFEISFRFFDIHGAPGGTAGGYSLRHGKPGAGVLAVFGCVRAGKSFPRAADLLLRQKGSGMGAGQAVYREIFHQVPEKGRIRRTEAVPPGRQAGNVPGSAAFRGHSPARHRCLDGHPCRQFPGLRHQGHFRGRVLRGGAGRNHHGRHQHDRNSCIRIIREPLIKAARTGSERFFSSRKVQKWRNTVCISHF